MLSHNGIQPAAQADSSFIHNSALADVTACVERKGNLAYAAIWVHNVTLMNQLLLCVRSRGQQCIKP